MVYDDVNIFGGCIRTIKKNVLLFGSNENSLDVNTEKTDYVVMSRDQNAGRNHYMKISTKFFKCVWKSSNILERH